MELIEIFSSNLKRNQVEWIEIFMLGIGFFMLVCFFYAMYLVCKNISVYEVNENLTDKNNSKAALASDFIKVKQKLENLGLLASQIDTIIYFILSKDKCDSKWTIHNWFINDEKEVSIIYTIEDLAENTKTKYVYSVLKGSSYCQQWSDDRTYEYFEKTYKRIQESKQFEIYE